MEEERQGREAAVFRDLRVSDPRMRIRDLRASNGSCAIGIDASRFRSRALLTALGAQGGDQPVGEVAAESLLEPVQRGFPLFVSAVEGLDVGEQSRRTGGGDLCENGGTHMSRIGVGCAPPNPCLE